MGQIFMIDGELPVRFPEKTNTCLHLGRMLQCQWSIQPIKVLLAVGGSIHPAYSAGGKFDSRGRRFFISPVLSDRGTATLASSS